MRECIIIAHRGASGLAPENTLMSFNLAIELKADMIELDVHETYDGHLVCIHDYEVDRTTNGTGIVAEMTLNEILGLDADQNQHIPLLSEVLDLAYNRIRVNIELKTTNIENKVVELLKEKQMIDKVMVSSFLHGSLQTINTIDPAVETAVLVNVPMNGLIEYISELKAKALNPIFSMVTPDLVKQLHDHDIRVYPWTINDPLTMKNLFDMNVNGIITDYPDIAVETLRKTSIK
ncbi:glycerophosphodiester phosphodiesterase [Candidatus Thorarchaeota archaeon]|nr:MAG: glycerophosphodiester phosphodiesterase [Candidatus Thorarchaeota archaeon]